MNRNRPLSLALSLCLLSLFSCDDGDGDGDKVADQHKVFFVGYVYDGASGGRLKPDQITAISIKYRDKVVRTTIEPDGRFVSVDPLPTWQDYAVYVGAPGYRAFVSRNAGVDVPRSLAMTDGVASTATTQTFHYDAYLFPLALKTPKLTISIEKSDGPTAMPAPARAAGTLRLRPESVSVLERPPVTVEIGPSGNPVAVASSGRRWANDEDLLNQTVIKPFVDGRAEIAEGDLAYGVAYQVAVFDVKGYQPVVLSGGMSLIAGSVSSRSITLPKEQQEPLRVLSTNSDVCTLPATLAADYGATVQITLSEEAEFVGTNYAEDIDNGVNVAPSAVTSGQYCALKTSIDPTKQERGTRITLAGNVITLAFNPSLGFSTMSSYGGTCTLPPALTSVVYGNLSAINLKPKGEDATRKRSLGTMLGELTQGQGQFVSGSISCGARGSVF